MRTASIHRTGVSILSALALTIAACRTERVAPAGPITIAFLTDLDGVTAPCGCTSDPLGGLDRVAARVEQLRRQGPFALVLVGNTFLDQKDPPAHRIEQETREAETIGEILRRLRPAAILPGPFDLGEDPTWVRQLGRDLRLPLMAPPRTPTTRLRADSTVIELGGVRIGLVGVSGDPAGESNSYGGGAMTLKANAADFVIGLVGIDGRPSRAFIAETTGLNVAVTGGERRPTEPQMFGGTLVADAGDQGQYLGLLRLYPRFGAEAKPKERRAWVYDDAGRAKQQRLRDRIGRMRAEIDLLEPGDARKAREAKLTELTAELDKVGSTRPEGSYVTWEVQRIDRSIEPAGWATDRIAGYNRSLCPLAIEATAELPCPSAPSPAEAYAGDAKCAECHAGAMRFHEGTAHAHAWKTLTDAGKECDLGCIGCHTVGYERPGGFCRVADAKDHANVGCESCHGPGAGHAAAHGGTGGSTAFVAAPGEAVCRTCHTPDHSDLFDFAIYRPKILGAGHGEKRLLPAGHVPPSGQVP